MSSESVMPSSHLILCCPLLLLPPIPPSIRVFSNESTLHMRWSKYWNFSFSISPSNEHPGLISFRIDWLNLLAVQGTLTSLLQHHSSKESILRHSAFFIVQLSHPYMTTGKTIAFTRQTFVMSLLFNMLSRLVIYITICKTDRQCRFDAWDWALRAGALGWPWLMEWGGWWEGGSGWRTHVHPWLIHVNVWQKPLQLISLQLKKKNPPVMWVTWVWTLGWEDPLEEGMATHSSSLVCRIPIDRGAWWATVHGVTRRQTRLND